MTEEGRFDDARLLDVAMAIADGETVEWPDARTAEAEGAPSGLIDRLQAVQRLVRGHGAIRAATPVDDELTARDTLLTEARRLAEAESPVAGPLVVRWGPLVVAEKIGHGSFGDVYRAWDPRLEREVALKVVPEPESARSRTVVDEGRLLAKVHHPNVLVIYGAERVDGRAGIWTEFVRGENLATLVERDGPMGPRNAARVGVDVCRALEAVHGAGLLHRDIKAQNVLRDESGRIILSDFGSGVVDERLAPDDSTGTDQGVAGTPLYLAPELFDEAIPSAQSDLYSVGVLLYFLLTGEFPVPGSSVAEIRASHHAGRRSALRVTKPDLPAGLTAVVDRLLAPDPAERPESAKSAAEAIEAWLSPRHTSPFLGWHVLGPAATVVVAGAIALVTWWGDAAFGPWSSGAAIFREIVNAPCPGAPVSAGSWICRQETSRGTYALSLFNVNQGGPPRTLVSFPPGMLPTSWVLSPDGQQVAYQVFARDTRQFELRLLDVASGSTATVPESSPGDLGLRRWMPDGRIEVRRAQTTEQGEVQTLELLDPQSGMSERLFRFPQGTQYSGISRSPDGRYIAFDYKEDDDSESDIRLCEIGGGCATVAAHPDVDSRPVFTPGGAVLFSSDRAGPNGLWRVELNGLQGSEPMQVRDDGRSEVHIYGFGPDGSIYYELVDSGTDIYTIRDDLEAPGSPVRLRESVRGYAHSPVWSLDGRLAYLTTSPRLGLVVEPPGGQARELSLPEGVLMNLGVGDLAWSPDGSRLAVRVMVDTSGTHVVHIIDRQSGALLDTVIRPGVPNPGARVIRDVHWLDDDRLLLNNTRALVAIRISARSEERLWRQERMLERVALSADRRTVAFVSVSDRNTRHTLRVNLLNVETGEHRVIHEEQDDWPPRLLVQDFTTDGRALLVTRPLVEDDVETNYLVLLNDLFRLPLDGGEMERVPVPSLRGLNEVVSAPDGRLAFSMQLDSRHFFVAAPSDWNR